MKSEECHWKHKTSLGRDTEKCMAEFQEGGCLDRGSPSEDCPAGGTSEPSELGRRASICLRTLPPCLLHYSDGQVWLNRPLKPSSQDGGWPGWREQPSVGLVILHLCSGLFLSVCQGPLPPPALFPKDPLLPRGPQGMSMCLSFCLSS